MLDESGLLSSCSVERPCCCVVPGVLRFVIILLSSSHEYMVSFLRKRSLGHSICLLPITHFVRYFIGQRTFPDVLSARSREFEREQTMSTLR